MTYTPTHAQVESSKRRELLSGVIVGLALIGARLVVPTLPILNGHTLNEGNGLCTGAVGLIVRGLGGARAAQVCGEVGHWMLALNLGAIGGAALALTCGAYLVVQYQRPAAPTP